MHAYLKFQITVLLVLLYAPVARAVPLTNVQINDDVGATGTSNFTQSETSLLVFGSTVVAAFNDSGSNAGPTNKFTGYARSTDGGTTWTDLGTLPTNAGGDAGDPVLARNSVNGNVYLATLGFSQSNIQLFKSADGGVTFSTPVNATPGRTVADRNNLAVDNFTGSGQGNVYLAVRTFDAAGGIFLFRSTDNGATFGPNGGTLIASAASHPLVQDPWVAVAPDHSVNVFYYDGTGNTIRMDKSIDGGVTFGPASTVATLSPTLGLNGDLGLTGIRNGTVTPAPFRTQVPFQGAINPVTGQIYVVYADKGFGSDRGDIFLKNSTDGGLTWSSRLQVNTDLTFNDQWQPTLTITPDGKHLGIFWYDRRLDPGNNLIDYFGRTCEIIASNLICSSDVRISDVSFLPEFGRDAVVNSTYMGDYDIAQADNSFFYVAWGDNRLPLPNGGDRMDPNVFFDAISTGEVVVATPEPATLLLLGLGLAVSWRLRRRFHRASKDV